MDSSAIPIPDKLVDYIRSLEIEEQPTLQRMTVQNVVATPDATIPPRFDVMILKGGRNNGVSEYVWNLWQNVTTSPEQLLDLAREYNEEHCWPPLSDDEIKAIVNGKLDKPVTGANALTLGGKPLSSGSTAGEVPALVTTRPMNDATLFEGLTGEMESLEDYMSPFDLLCELPMNGTAEMVKYVVDKIGVGNILSQIESYQLDFKRPALPNPAYDFVLDKALGANEGCPTWRAVSSSADLPAPTSPHS